MFDEKFNIRNGGEKNMTKNLGGCRLKIKTATSFFIYRNNPHHYTCDDRHKCNRESMQFQIRVRVQCFPRGCFFAVEVCRHGDHNGVVGGEFHRRDEKINIF